MNILGRMLSLLLLTVHQKMKGSSCIESVDPLFVSYDQVGLGILALAAVPKGDHSILVWDSVLDLA